MSAFTFSAAVGIVVLSVTILVRAIRIVFMIIRILFALLIKIFSLFKRHSRPSSRKCKKTISLHSEDISPVEIGKQGEDDLCRRLKKIEKDGKILRNLHIPAFNGKVTEIDAIMLTKHGIYVFEYKNYHCNMLIPENAENNWIRCVDNSSSVYEVYSPVRQNNYHVKALTRLLGSISGTHCIGNYIQSYVVLGDGCRIQTEKKSLSSNTKIMNLSELCHLSGDSEVVIPTITLKLIEELLGRYQNSMILEKER